MNTWITIPEAAKALGVAGCTLRRWIEKGCPVARPGGKGRGRATLVDLEAVRAWQGRSGFTAEQISELTAMGVWRALSTTDDARIRSALSEWFTKSWYFTAAAAYEIEGRWDEPAEPDVIKHMRGMYETP